jgi:tetratricopeptide (TPR) repeat protein
MDAAALGAALERYRRYNPEPSFPVVVDAGGRLAAAFGPFDQLPLTLLIAQDGAISYRAEGFGTEQAALLTSKVERVFVQAGRPFPAAREGFGPGGGVEPPSPVDEEAPSIRRRREQDERLRSNIVQGDALFMAWEFERALPYYLAALETQPNDLHALVRGAQILERLGQQRRALELWERVLALRPDHPEARERLGGQRPAR